MKGYFVPVALLPQGWAEAVLITVDDLGFVSEVRSGAEPDAAEMIRGPVVPGMPNLHSHAFQRAMAGLAERAGPGGDSFWTWREIMYAFLARLTPEDVEAVAAQLYLEMLKAGYTAVGEFHYLHHGADGTAYDEPAEMSHRVIAAAEGVGIGITQLPVLYRYGGFGALEAGAAQGRFLNDPDGYARIISALAANYGGNPQVTVGIAPHSLRAVSQESLKAAIAALDQLDDAAPIHIHIAEQTKEVEDCLAWSGRRPVEWLFDRFAPDHRWCLVHATHMNESECAALARSGAVAGLCPTTEANLGDGLFPAVEFLAAGGRFGIGSDSHISVSLIEELRWLEYGQRLFHHGRNLLAEGPGGSVGARLYREALAGGAQALGRPIGQIAPGYRADFLVLDGESPALAGKSGDRILDAMIFAGNVNPIRDVMVGGRWVVREGRHDGEEAVAAAFSRTLSALMRE